MHVKSGTITQNSQVFSYLQRQPPGQDEMQHQLPEYQTMPATVNQNPSRLASHEDNFVSHEESFPQQPNMRIAVELNRSSDMSLSRTQQ